MTDHRVFSGYTEKIDEQRKAWYEQLAGKRLEWEELASAGSTNEVLGKLESVPLYQYLVNYLLYVWEKGENREIRYDQMISDLTDRVADAFKKNGMPEESARRLMSEICLRPSGAENGTVSREQPAAVCLNWGWAWGFRRMTWSSCCRRRSEERDLITMIRKK